MARHVGSGAGPDQERPGQPYCPNRPGEPRVEVSLDAITKRPPLNMQALYEDDDLVQGPAGVVRAVGHRGGRGGAGP